MDPKDVDDFVNWVKADQEQAEFEDRRTNRVQAEALTLLRGLSSNWTFGVDMADGPKERRTAVVLLAWSGCVETRFGLSLYSDAPAVRAEVIAKGRPWEKVLLPEAQRHLGRFLRGRVSLQQDPKRELRLTRDGERCQFDLNKHPDNGWIVWQFVSSHWATPQVGFRMLDQPVTPGNVTAVAGAQATASVGNIVVQNTIDLGSLARLGRQSPAPAVGQAGQLVPGGAATESTPIEATAPAKPQTQPPRKPKTRKPKKPVPRAMSRRGRPPKTEPDKMDKVADKIIAQGLNARCSYPALAKQFASELPEGTTASALRHRVLRRQDLNAKERAKIAPKK